MGESTSSSLQLSFDDEINENNPPTNPVSTGSISEIRKSSVTSMGTGATKDFFSNISNDINGLANQTTSMFTDLFGKDFQKNKKHFLVAQKMLNSNFGCLHYEI